MQLAEGVEFLEKYAHLDHLEAPVGGEGRWSKWIPAVQARIIGWQLVRLAERVEVDAEVEGLGDRMPGPPGTGAVFAMNLRLRQRAGTNSRIGILNFDIDQVLLA